MVDGRGGLDLKKKTLWKRRKRIFAGSFAGDSSTRNRKMFKDHNGNESRFWKENNNNSQVNSDMKQLVEIPGTTPPERYQTLVVNVAKGPVPGVSSRSVLRNREFVSFNRVAIYPEYVLAFLRKLT